MESNRLLVEKAKKGNQQAFIQLFQNYETVLYNMARKFLLIEEDIADCLQETAFDAFQNIHKLKKPQHFNTWLCRILINHCKKVGQKNQRYHIYDYAFESETTSELNEEVLDLRAMLLQMDQKYREPLVLYYYNGFSIREISQILAIPQNTVKTRLSRGKEILKFNTLREGRRRNVGNKFQGTYQAE